MKMTSCVGPFLGGSDESLGLPCLAIRLLAAENICLQCPLSCWLPDASDPFLIVPEHRGNAICWTFPTFLRTI